MVEIGKSILSDNEVSLDVSDIEDCHTAIELVNQTPKIKIQKDHPRMVSPQQKDLNDLKFERLNNLQYYFRNSTMIFNEFQNSEKMNYLVSLVGFLSF